MKELTIEQKAKAYDEALKRAIAAHKDEDRHLKATLERIFSELKESEDEKIRKTLKHYLEVRRCQTQSDEEYINCNNFLAWLEKQGEHKKFRDSIQVGDEVTRNSDGVIVNMSQLKRVAKPAQQKLPIEKLPEEMKTIEESLGFTTQKECDEYNQMVSGLIMSDDNKEEQKQNVDNKKLTDVNHEYFSELLENDDSKDINDYAYQVAYCMSHDWLKDNATWKDIQQACKLGAEWQKQKLTWSEEDEYNSKLISSTINRDQDLSLKTKDKLTSWIKSIKQRIGG